MYVRAISCPLFLHKYPVLGVSFCHDAPTSCPALHMNALHPNTAQSAVLSLLNMSPKQHTDAHYHPIPSLFCPRNALFDEFPKLRTLRPDKKGYFSSLTECQVHRVFLYTKREVVQVRCELEILHPELWVPEDPRGAQSHGGAVGSPWQGSRHRAGLGLWGPLQPKLFYKQTEEFEGKKKIRKKKRKKRFRSGSWNRTGERWQCRNRTTSLCRQTHHGSATAKPAQRRHVNERTINRSPCDVRKAAAPLENPRSSRAIGPAAPRLKVPRSARTGRPPPFRAAPHPPPFPQRSPARRWAAAAPTATRSPERPRCRSLTLSESRSGSAWQRRKRKDLGSLQSVCRVVRKQVPPTFSRTHLPGTAPGGGAELHRRQGPPGPRPPIGATGKSQWFSAAILTAGRVRPAYGSAGAPPPEASTSARSAYRPAVRRGPRAPARRHAALPPHSSAPPRRSAPPGSWIAAPPPPSAAAGAPRSPRPFPWRGAAEGAGGGRARTLHAFITDYRA